SGDGQYDKTAYPAGKVVPGGKVVAMLRHYPNLYGDLSAGSGLNALKR
ncbi:MAG: amidohydrolase, partial [bacterium (Candidatus Ratteibacteria) CG23_combo_of_CG06-09_8_20_14_all_48_7]